MSAKVDSQKGNSPETAIFIKVFNIYITCKSMVILEQPRKKIKLAWKQPLLYESVTARWLNLISSKMYGEYNV